MKGALFAVLFLSFSHQKMTGVIDSDTIQLLPDSNLPICSFAMIGIFAKPQSGKTYQTMRLKRAYIEQAKKHPYDLNDPTVLNGPFDACFYISPSVCNDKTLTDEDK